MNWNVIEKSQGKSAMRVPRDLTRRERKDKVRVNSGLSSFLMTNAPDKAYWRRYQNTTSLETYKGPNGYSIKFLNDPPDWYTTALSPSDPYIFMRKTRPPSSTLDKATTPFGRGDVLRRFKDKDRLPPLQEVKGYNLVQKPETTSWSTRFISIASGGSDVKVRLLSSSGRKRQLHEILLEANTKYSNTKLNKRIKTFNDNIQGVIRNKDVDTKFSSSQMKKRLPNLLG